ncbi:MAG: ABC transporter ATP-binding protein [Defluviitaleaceae bacterium]|nr:ABC transporter ATP-binding protein [Defluviitaleaceae bacterium]
MIVVDNITIKFGNKVIFENFTAKFSDLDIYCIVGKSGCGKSTLLRAISGLLKPSAGQIIVNDKVVKKPSAEIAVMYQRYENYPWLSVLDNTLFPVKMQRKITNADKDRAVDILERFGLADDLKKLPHELSGGMNQRLAMASVIMNNPPVLLMDEPLSALDPENREKLQDFLLEFNNGDNQIIIVTHSMEEAEKLSKGKILKL